MILWIAATALVLIVFLGSETPSCSAFIKTSHVATIASLLCIFTRRLATENLLNGHLHAISFRVVSVAGSLVRQAQVCHRCCSTRKSPTAAASSLISHGFSALDFPWERVKAGWELLAQVIRVWDRHIQGTELGKIVVYMLEALGTRVFTQREGLHQLSCHSISCINTI
jgi:hypothetical protein